MVPAMFGNEWIDYCMLLLQSIMVLAGVFVRAVNVSILLVRCYCYFALS
jgi:hypothetical protein